MDKNFARILFKNNVYTSEAPFVRCILNHRRRGGHKEFWLDEDEFDSEFMSTKIEMLLADGKWMEADRLWSIRLEYPSFHLEFPARYKLNGTDTSQVVTLGIAKRLPFSTLLRDSIEFLMDERFTEEEWIKFRNHLKG